MTIQEENSFKFDPFQDRLSRDVRNELSSALAGSLESGSLEKINSVADGFLQKSPPSIYVEYIHKRVTCYQLALKAIWEGPEEDPIRRAMILWEHGLYFEVHEVLEHAWYDAKGEQRKVLQALIRAAGTFLKRELGYTRQADKIAAKATEALENTNYLDDYFDVRPLIDALADGGRNAPSLLKSGKNIS